MFKNTNDLKFLHQFSNVLQVNSVSVDNDHRNQGIGTKIYKALVDAGYTLVSDTTQFEPAKAMWQKLSKIATVYVADIDYGLFKDESGQAILYNGHNIPDQDIWTTGSNFDGTYRVLILTK